MSNAKRHPQPAVVLEGEAWALYDQRTGYSLGSFTTCEAAREKCRVLWPTYTFRWGYNVRGEASGTASSVRVTLS